MASGDLDPRRARAQLTRVLREVFGERPRRVERLAEGITNAVFRVSLDGDWVVRLNADAAKTRQFAKEQWAMERAYLDSWHTAVPGALAYREFVSHWTTPEFEAYVSGLERAADSADDFDFEASSRAFRDVARLERGFWDMALVG